MKNALSRQRSVFVGIALVDMLIVGMAYSWSLFLAPMQADLQWSRETLTVAFTLNMSLYCLGNLLSSALNKRMDFRGVLMISAGCIAVGYTATGHTRSAMQLYFGYGVLCGIGNGMMFNTLINAVLRFFDDNVGTVTGFLMLLLGVSNMLLGPVITLGIATVGWRSVFWWIAALSLALGLGGALVCPKGKPVAAASRETAAGSLFAAESILHKRTFWVLFAWSMCFAMLGQAYIGQAAACGADIGATAIQSTILVSLFSAFNGIGRMALGRFYDRKEKVAGMRILSVVYFGGCAALAGGSALRTLFLLYIGSCLIGFGYGGLMITNATAMRAYFGNRDFSLNLSLITLASIPGSMLGTLALNAAKGAFRGYAQAFLLFLIIPVLSFALTHCLREPGAEAGAADTGIDPVHIR